MKPLKHIIFVGFILSLSFVWLNKFIPILEQKKLSGAYEEPNKVGLTFDTWFNNAYQENHIERKEFNLPLRPTMIRIRNQFDYSCFNIGHYYSVLIGKNGYVFSKEMAENVGGKLDRPESYYEDSLSIFKEFQAYKQKQGGTFFIMVAPTKERLFPQFLPKGYEKSEETDYTYLTKALAKNNINHIDFVERFESMIDTSEHLLYGKTGTHWTMWGAHIAMTEMLDSIESQCHLTLPSWKLDYIEKKPPLPDDKDIEETMNLLFPIKTKDHTYPTYSQTIATDSVYKPKVIVISDSFYWAINNTRIPYQIFSKKSGFWYYFKKNLSHTPSLTSPIDEVNVLEEIKSADAVLMLVCSENMDTFPFGFGQFLKDNKNEFNLDSIN